MSRCDYARDHSAIPRCEREAAHLIRLPLGDTARLCDEHTERVRRLREERPTLRPTTITPLSDLPADGRVPLAALVPAPVPGSPEFLAAAEAWRARTGPAGQERDAAVEAWAARLARQ